MTGSEAANGWIVFDQVEIDLAGRRLFVAGAETPLEPKADPARWPEVEPSIETSERLTGRYNFLRLIQPDPDYAKILGALEAALRDRTSSYHLLIWNPEFAPLRRDPAFQDFLRRTHMIDYWRSNRWPPQCKPEGDGARCD